ncbi:MAG: hypothetical protein KJZ55_03955, partial [Flavobacteriales bacterium]|nr:hypothetical protein [Flavobacteriales bacterium]
KKVFFSNSSNAVYIPRNNFHNKYKFKKSKILFFPDTNYTNFLFNEIPIFVKGKISSTYVLQRRKKEL